MSCDWDRYSSAQSTRARNGRPERFGVMRLNAGGIRQVVGLSLDHDPIDENRAHSSILGLGPSDVPAEQRKNLTRLRYELHERFNSWEIRPSDPVAVSVVETMGPS